MVVYNATRVYKSLQSLDMDFFKTIAGRVITGIITTLVFGAGIGLWQMDSSTRSSLMSHTGKIISWLGVVLLTPFLTFFVILDFASILKFSLILFEFFKSFSRTSRAG